MIIRFEESAHTKQPCFVCGGWERPDNPDAFAYDAEVLLGYVCSTCQELPVPALREKVRQRAREYRDFAAALERLADGPIQTPAPEQIDAVRAERFVTHMEFELERNRLHWGDFEEDLPF